MRRVRESLEGSTGRAYSGREARLWGPGGAADAAADADAQQLAVRSAHGSDPGAVQSTAPATTTSDAPAATGDADPQAELTGMQPRELLKQMLGDLYVDVDSLLGLSDVAEGGFATVQKATLTHANGMKQLVAVKKLKSHLINATDFTEFVKEANLWRKLKSGDIVSIIGIGAMDVTNFHTIRSSLFVVSEFMQGGTLRDFVMKAMFDSSHQTYKMDDAFRWFIAITRAVKYLHGCLPIIIHRDLKLENVLLTGTNTSTSDAKVVDLGLHMRGKHTTDNEGSFYGGNAFDAAKHDGSVRPGQQLGGATLADKVRMAESRSINVSMPSSNIAKLPSPHNTNPRHAAPMLTIAEDPDRADASTFEASTHTDAANASHHDAAPANAPQDSDENALNLEFLPKGYSAPSQPPDCGCKCLPASSKSPRHSDGGGGTAGNSLTGRKASSESAKLPVASNTGSSSETGGSQRTANSGANADLFTGQVGSYMYMAPEMVTSHSYNEKVDVFSLTVMFYETLRCYLNISKVAHSGDPDDIARYAIKVSKGFRESMPPYWPEPVRELISRGWAQDPKDRPTAGEFLKELQRMVDDDIPTIMEARRPKRLNINPKFDCGCCIA